MQKLENVERCSACGGPIIKAPNNNEFVCSRCGIVRKSYSLVHRLPMGVTYQPTNQIVFGRGLGNTLDRFGLLRVLAKGKNGTEDLGIRARQICILASTIEPQALKNALQHASKALTILGFAENHLLSNDTGSLLRKATSWLLIAKCKFHSKELAHASIYYVLKKYGMSPEPPEKRNNGTVETVVLKFNAKYIDLITWIDQSTRGF